MEIIPNFVWEEIKKELPAKKNNRGRPEYDSKKAFEGIVYVLKSGCQWKLLPKEYGKCSTIHGKFMKWSREGIFEQLMKRAAKTYLSRLGENPNWFAIDASFSKAPFARWGGKNPTDRRKNGVKKSIVVDRKGAPLAVTSGAANTHDSKFYEQTLAKLKGLPLAPLKIITADSAFDVNRLRKVSKKDNFILLAATNPRRKKNIRKYKPPHRWVVERTFGWFHWYRALKTCWCKTKIAFSSLLTFTATIQLFRMS